MRPPPPPSRPSQTPPPLLLPPALLAMPTESLLLLLTTLEAAPRPAGEFGLRRDRENFLCSVLSLLLTCRATALARRLSKSSSSVCWVSASWISDSDSYAAKVVWGRQR